MGYFIDGFKALKVSLGNVFRKPITVEYPEVIRPRRERYRASSFALVHDEQGDEACIGCLQCERICPSQVISVKPAGKRDSPVTGKKRGYADDFSLDLTACIFCELCVQVCPTDAIVMCTTPEMPTFTREGLVLSMARLYENEKARTASWANGSKLMDLQKPPPAAPAKADPPHDAAAESPKPPAGAAS